MMRLLGAIFWLGVAALLMGFPKVVLWLSILFVALLIFRAPFAFLLGTVLGISIFGGNDSGPEC